MQEATMKASSRKLHAKYTPIVFAFYMSMIMAFLMSLIIVATNSGITDHYLNQVVHAYRIAMPAAFFCILVVRPVVMFLVRHTIRS